MNLFDAIRQGEDIHELRKHFRVLENDIGFCPKKEQREHNPVWRARNWDRYAYEFSVTEPPTHSDKPIHCLSTWHVVSCLRYREVSDERIAEWLESFVKPQQAQA